MRKFYFFISALVCIMGGVNFANAQVDSEVTDIPLELNAASAVMKLVKYDDGSDNQLSRTPSKVPAESRVLWAFSGDKFLSRTGMVWGTDNGNDPGQIDLRNGTSEGFDFYGRKGFNGEFVAQMYTLADEVKTMDISFKFVSDETQLAFSVWKVSSSAATLLESKVDGWESGQTYTFNVAMLTESPISRYGDRIVLLWSSGTGYVNVNISEFSATAHCTPNSASDVKFKVHKEGSEETSFEHTMRLPVNQTLNTADLLPSLGWISFEGKEFTLTGESNEISVSYTYNKNAEYPCAISYEDLTAENLWVSFITQMNRMHVYDANSVGNNYVYNSTTETYENKGTVKKYPTIDRATFANLSDRKFWGLVCENPLESSCVKIYNKGEGNQNTLYLTKSDDDSPLLFVTEGEGVPDTWITDEWIVEKGNKEGDIQYFCLKANGTTQVINNNKNAGYMTTWKGSPTTGDNAKGSNIRFVGELETYKIMRDRALAAPSNAINSLTAEARAKMVNTNTTVLEYKAEIAAIQDLRDGGVIPFVEGGYYYLRNYTPADGKTYVLDSKDGATATTSEVATNLPNSDDMTYSNINAIWKITTDSRYPAVEIGSQDIGVSKTIGRFVTHVNSYKRLNGVADPKLSDAGATYFFVNLGAGQHFLKNVQYKGSGEQAKAASLSCDDNGSLGTHSIQNNNQNKNTRSTWYGIPVNSIDVTITDAGYATIYLPFGVTLPEGDNTLTAYAVTAAAGGVATLTAVENIPANKGVILKGTAGETYTLKIDDNVSWTEDIDNKLKGSCMAENVTEDAYVLSKQGDAVGLYRAEKNLGDDNNAWRNNDNKAYLPASLVTEGTTEDARFLSFNFDTVTGLDVIKGTESTSAEASAVYDLSGRRVRAAQKGLYIMNGKKVIK